jgi:streptogramin lyase
VQLSILVPSVTVWNVYDLPLWAWRAYAKYVDDYRAQKAKEARDGR